jgi:hypothetical protein
MAGRLYTPVFLAVNNIRSRSHITTDSQSASLSWCQAPIWDPRSILLSPWIFFRQLRVCNFVAPSLTRRRACNLLYNCFWALPEQSLLGRSPAEHTTIFYCLIWDSPNLEGQIPVFISPRNRVAQLYPRELNYCLGDREKCRGGSETGLPDPSYITCDRINTTGQ